MGLCPHFEERELGPHLTLSLGSRPTSLQSGVLIHPATWAENRGGLRPFWGGEPTCVPSFIFIHTTVWPQCTNVTGQERQLSDSIGRTVLQTVRMVQPFLCSSRQKVPILCFANSSPKKTVRPMLSDRCLSCPICPILCLSATLMFSWPNGGWIKMPFVMEVDLRPGGIVLDRDLSPQRAHPQFSAHVCCG